MYYVLIISIILAYIIIIFPYRNKLQLGSIVAFIIIAIFLSKVTNTPDISNYIYIYTSTYVKDQGFSYLAHYFYNLGWTYYQFQTVYMFIGLCVFDIAMIRMELPIKRVYVYILYFLYPFLLNVVQIRNFLVMALLLLAFSITYREENKKLRYIKWCIIIGFAATQHLIALAYLPFIFICDNKIIFRRFIKLFTVITIVIALFPDSVIDLLNKYMLLIAGESRLSGYEVATVIGRFFNILVVFSIVALVFAILKITKRTQCEIDTFSFDVVSTSLFVERLSDLVLYSILFCPLFIVNANCARLVQNIFPLIYIAVVFILHCYHHLSYKSNDLLVYYKKNLKIVLIIFIPLFSYYTYSIWIELHDIVVIPIFSSL